MTKRTVDVVTTRSAITVAMAPLRHDVRNKLATIRQAAFYLSEKTKGTELWSAEPRVARFFEIIDREVAMLDTLVTETASVSSPAAAPSVLDPAACVELALARLDTAVRDRTVLDVAPDPFLGDAEDTALALACLVENAAEADPGPLRIEGRREGGLYTLAVVDAGPGIGADDVATMVRPFVTTREGRLGLGLPVADLLCRRFGGELRFTPGERPHRVTMVLPSP